MKVLLAKILFYVIGLMPLWMARGLGFFVGEISWLMNSRGTQIAIANIEHCFPELPEQARKELAHNSMREWGKTVCETMVVWQRSFDWTNKKIVGQQNAEVFERALSKENGIILLSPHLGNWEVLRTMTARRDMTALYQPPEYEALDKIVRAARAEGGTKLVPTNKNGVIALVKALKKGEMTMLLPDQTPIHRSSGIYAPFYNKPALTITLVSKLVSTKATIVMVTAKRVKGGFEIIFAEPDPEIYSDDEATSVAAMNRSVENLVQQLPEQYQWEYKRFKKQPRGETKIYKN